MAVCGDASTGPRRSIRLLLGLLLALAGVFFGLSAPAIAGSASTASVYSYDRPCSSADARAMAAPAGAVGGPRRAHPPRDAQTPIPHGDFARPFDATISMPAPTTAVLRGYDVVANLLAAASASKSTGRLAAPRHAVAPTVCRLLPGSAVAAEGAARMPGVIRAGELKLPGVPSGASGVPVQTGKGLEYAIPRGTPEIDPRVTGIRIMDPVTTGKYQYPNGYAVYMNEAQTSGSSGDEARLTWTFSPGEPSESML